MIVSLYGPDYIMADFGHIDLFIGNNAEALVWQPILSWVVEHTAGNGKNKEFHKDF